MQAQTKRTEMALYEIKKQTEDKIIYQRVLKPKGRSRKEISKAVSELPVTTLHVFTEEEFQRLKEIELKLSKILKEKKSGSSFKDIIFSFLEI